MASDSNLVHFQTKFLIGWAILGLGFGMAMLISEIIAPRGNFNGIGEVLGYAIALIPGMVVVGFFCFLIEGLFIHKANFSELTHPQWAWYVYPVFFLWTIAFAFTLGFFLTLFKSK